VALPETRLECVPAERGLTVRETAKFLRIGPDRVRALIRRGELGAINTAPTLAGKPRFVVLPEHLSEFVRRRMAGPPPRPPKRRRRTPQIDYYP
jgi:hypothetical protein